MSMLPFDRAGELGFDSKRLRVAADLACHWIDTDQVPAIGLCIGRKSGLLEPLLLGRNRPEPDAPSLKPDALFLVASLTKPVTVTAAMMLVERGLIGLDDPVAAFVPAFGANGKQDVRIRHLMTHTSGLPDQVPSNLQLRRERKPLADFVAATCELPLQFPPGTQVQYQSMGTAMLGEIVREVCGKPLPQFLQGELFEPLGMPDTSLGWDAAKKDRIAAVRLPPGATIHETVWNTPYWLGFGAPWGGLITSPADYARFCQMFLGQGTLAGIRVLAPATVQAMTTNQLAGMPRISEEERRCRPWGLGWRLNWPGHSSNFGDLLGPRSYGHWGSTGTLCWIDPATETFAVILTTQPQEPEGRFLARLSNAVCAAIL